MNWRATLIGAGIALIISVLAGVLVWHLTRGPQRDSFEELIYTPESIATFDTQRLRLHLFSLKVRNAGGKASNDVRIVVSFKTDSEIRERNIVLSSGPVGRYAEKLIDKKTLEVTLPVLAPGESINISLMVAGGRDLSPELGVRSREAIGKSEEVRAAAKDTRVTAADTALIIAVLFGAVFMTFIVQAALLSRRRGPWWQSYNDLNNTAFVYLQNGLTNDALKLLEADLMAEGGHPVTLANIALAKGLSGDEEGSRKTFAAAEWWAKSKHHRAVISFDRAILAIAHSQHEAARKALGEALELSPKRISKYCEMSVYIKEARKTDPGIDELLKKPVH